MRPSDSLLDTIVAPATPAGRSALAIVRLSGRDTLRILGALAPHLPSPPDPRRPCLLALQDSGGDPIDTGLVTFFAGPASVTGEDVGELSVHGSPAVVERLLRAAIDAGARLARPGEFTERAFRRGKVDLLRAEAVRDLIEARTPAAAEASARRLSGAISQRIHAVREDLLAAAAGLAAALDFSEDTGESVDPAVEAALQRAIDSLARLSESYQTGRLLADGCRVAILGLPNAGKSTLFNALAGTARAIVTEIPGTTRDTLEAFIDVRGIPVTLVDTAGLRETEDLVEKIGVERAWEQADRCDAILYVYDAAVGWTESDARAWEACGAAPSKPRMLVANKVDRAREPPHGDPLQAVRLCGLWPDAGARLRALVQDTLAASIQTEASSEMLGSLRQRNLVEDARCAAVQTLSALRDGLSPEYAATHCHAALDELADLTGETTPEDVLARLFSTFCIGK
ncbi:MAG: tRNA uridine-5-carboxymethylaminomethyl(34) synthesis GTPase MnmE [Acidobacteriota bacterium]